MLQKTFDIQLKERAARVEAALEALYSGGLGVGAGSEADFEADSEGGFTAAFDAGSEAKADSKADFEADSEGGFTAAFDAGSEAKADSKAWGGAGLEAGGVPPGLLRAMRYSLLAGGKRLRPVLCLSCAGLFGLSSERAMPFALGLELVHTYSLIHDDLPCMDDDDLRRGKPSCHKRFGECTAVLAGDSLLTDAFAFMAHSASVGGIASGLVLRAIFEVASAAGSAGMAGGQFLDMAYTGGRAEEESGREDGQIRSGCPEKGAPGISEIATMHALKTGALIRASCISGAIIAGAGADDIRRMGVYGKNVGAAFQIVDDILDETGSEKDLGKPVGSDRGNTKLTYPALLGLEASRELALRHVEAALQAVKTLSGPDADMLKGLAEFVVNRVS